MKASAIALFVLGVVGIVVAPVGAAVMRFSPFLSGQKPKAINAQSIKGVQTEGLHTNDVIHQVWDSSLVPHGTIVSTEIYWLDNSTLLFAADKDPKPAAGTNPIRVPWLFLWRLGEKPQPVGEDPQEATHFYRAAGGIACFQQKKIAPTTGQTAKVLMKGPPGEERETPPWKWLTVQHDGVPSNGEGGVAIEDIDCEQFADPAMAGRIYETDSYRRYYVDRVSYPPGLPPVAGEYPVLMKSDGSDRKVLPIPLDEFSGVLFRTFEDVFWSLENSMGISLRIRGEPMVDGFEKWKKTNCLAVWRIDPGSGASDRRCITFGSWSGQASDAAHGYSASIHLIPTVRGLFFSSRRYTDSNDPQHVGASGLYRLENDGPRRVLIGYVENTTQSPDGCRLAFIYGPNWASRAHGTAASWTIAAIDLCASNSLQQAN